MSTGSTAKELMQIVKQMIEEDDQIIQALNDEEPQLSAQLIQVKALK